MLPSPDKRFWKKVNQAGPIPEHRPEIGPCWLWTGSLTYHGYGRVRRLGRIFLAHDITYESVHGPMPKGLEPDHLCRVRNCVHPLHMEAVTHKVNSLRGDSPLAKNARKTHCVRGHLLVSRKRNGYRECRVCKENSRKAWRKNRREQGLCVK